MSPKYLHLFFALLFILLAGCSSESGRVSGTHFQGKDCLLCHNVDLKKSAHLSFGATLFQEVPNESNDETLEILCNIPLFLQLTNNSDVIYDSRKTNDVTDPGFNGDGNIFSLIEKQAIPSGAYRINIINKDGDVIKSTNTAHLFSEKYDPENPADSKNQYSCNACHRIDGPQIPLSTPSTCRN